MKCRLIPGLLFVVVLLTGCNAGKDDPRYAFDTPTMLANYADNLIIPTYAAFQANTRQLETAIAGYCEALTTPDASRQLAAARQQWLASAVVWQKAEVLLVGAAADNDDRLRRRINVYSETLTSPCQIDQATLGYATTPDTVTVNQLTDSQVGLGALDYLLFDQTTAYHCVSDPVPAGWQNLNKPQAKCALALAIAADLKKQAETLYNRWQTDGLNDRATFINPANASDNIQSLSDALFYLDTQVKDIKLGIPLGLKASQKCLDSCPSLVEYPYSQRSLSMLKANLEAFKLAFNGGSGFGFANIISEKGQQAWVDQFNRKIDAAITRVTGMQSSLFDQADLLKQDNGIDKARCANAVASPDTPEEQLPACQLYGLVKRITDDLKTGFVAAVDLDIPKRAQSDND